MNKFARFLLLTAICVIVISYSPRPAFGDTANPDTATCDITITVNSIIEWDANFAPIALDPITAQGSDPCGLAILTLWTNSNVALSSDQTPASQLTHNRGGGATEDTLVTEYKISTDGDGDPATGADSTAVTASNSDVWTVHGDFLETALAITHFNTDGAVEVTLEVRATNDTDNVADTGAYAATQTVTATFVSDN